MNRLISWMAASCVALPLCANAAIVTFAGESWETNGTATLANSGSTLRLTPSTEDQIGSAFLSSPMSVDSSTSFSVAFQFRIHDTGVNGAGDGLAFVLQSSNDGADAIGGGGGSGLGYDGISPSLAVEFDTFAITGEPDVPEVAIHINGDVSGNGLAGINLQDYELVRSSGDSDLYAWVDYDAPSLMLYVFLSEDASKPEFALLTANLDEALDQLLGEEIYLGFTAATGANSNIHDINSFSLVPVPVPAAGWLMLSGLAGLIGFSRRRAVGRAARTVAAA